MTYKYICLKGQHKRVSHSAHPGVQFFPWLLWYFAQPYSHFYTHHDSQIIYGAIVLTFWLSSTAYRAIMFVKSLCKWILSSLYAPSAVPTVAAQLCCGCDSSKCISWDSLYCEFYIYRNKIHIICYNLYISYNT